MAVPLLAIVFTFDIQRTQARAGTIDIVCPSSPLYVDAAVVGGTGNGNSWPNAISDLQDALAIASTCPNVKEVWVVTGVCTPGTTVSATFQLRTGIT